MKGHDPALEALWKNALDNWQLVSERQRIRYELCEQASQSVQCWQPISPRDSRQCCEPSHMLQRTQ